jgi:EAL domain-containing protein (putative c-di-GMP-specific phosphodiesterase class I)
MKVIAEGVETQDQLTALRNLKCSYGQGWLFAKPVSHEEAGALLSQDKRW